MYSEDDLTAAVEAGVLSGDAADAFRAHVAQSRQAAAVDEEHFRLVTGFNDIFVVIACCLLLGSVAWIGISIKPLLGPVLEAITAWLLAEYFVRRRRMALPAIVLMLGFVGGVFGFAMFAVGLMRASEVVIVLSASAVAAMAAFAHWRRFHVPITAAAIVGALVLFGLAMVKSVVAYESPLFTMAWFVAGAAAFVLAMRWDASDRERKTRRSDVAFWLHLLAAPLLVHPVFSSLGLFDGRTHAAQALLIVALYVAIAWVSLSIDRRALMVSALAYVLYAFSALLKDYGVVNLGFSITALAIGSALLLLSAFWAKSRAFVLKFYPHHLRERLAPLR